MKERLKQLRKALDFTQQQFADRIGIKRNSYANYETGRNTPIDAILISICREFDVNEDWLRDGIGEMFITRTRSEKITDFAADILTVAKSLYRRIRNSSSQESMSPSSHRWHSRAHPQGECPFCTVQE